MATFAGLELTGVSLPDGGGGAFFSDFAAFDLASVIGGGGGGGATLFYNMRGFRTAGGPVGFVFWENQTADLTGAPTGTITDEGVQSKRFV